MRRFIQILSWTALIMTVLPAVLFLAGAMEIHSMKGTMLFATVVWFITTPFWMGKGRKQPEKAS
jgi:hypothetical protein